MPNQLVDETFRDLQTRFRAQANPAREAEVRHFFKEPVETYGLPVPAVRATVREVMPSLRKQASLMDMLDLCERLLQTNHLEECLAVESLMTTAYVKQLTPGHFPILDHWVDYFTNWAVTDGVCGHVIGGLLERQPMLLPFLMPWTISDNRWRRRASCVSLCGLARHGQLLPSVVFSVTDNVMHDKDDMVQKGAGWLLKELSPHHPDAVIEYLKVWPNAGRTLVRYAIEKLTPEQKALFVKPKTVAAAS